MSEQPQDQPSNQPPNQPPPGQGQYQPPPVQGQYQSAPPRRLVRTSWDSPVSGVCGGIAAYLNLDPTLVRVLAVIAILVTFPVGLIAYFVMWGVMPKG